MVYDTKVDSAEANTVGQAQLVQHAEVSNRLARTMYYV